MVLPVHIFSIILLRSCLSCQSFVASPRGCESDYTEYSPEGHSQHQAVGDKKGAYAWGALVKEHFALFTVYKTKNHVA